MPAPNRAPASRTRASRARVARVAAREVLLTGGAVIGALCILMTVLGFAAGVQPLIFRSGSMSPAIETGDLAFASTVPAAELRPGDIVSVTNAAGERITHRLVDAAEQEGPLRQLTLQGDANDAPDAEVYTVRQADRVWFHFPKVGYVVGWLSGPIGLFLLGGYAMWLLSVLVKRKPPGAPAGDWPTAADEHRDDLEAKDRHGGPTVAAVVGASLLVGVAAGVGASTGTTTTLAAFGDPVAVTGTTVTASTIAKSPSFTCSVTGTRRITFTWTAVAGATSYIFHSGTGGATTTERTTTSMILTNSSGTQTGTAWVEVKRNFGSVAWLSAASTTRSYTLAATSSCT